MVEDIFFSAVEAWICDGYYADIRFIAAREGEVCKIWDAAIFLNPLPHRADLQTHIQSETIVIGKIQKNKLKKKSTIALLKKAARGKISVSKSDLQIHSESSLFFSSDISNRDLWSYNLHLSVVGSPRPPPTETELSKLDNVLRTADPPFDGMSDLASWLSLSAPSNQFNSSRITVRIAPPIDIAIAESSLADDILRLTLHAHPKFSTEHVKLAIRVIPGDGLLSRRQIASEIVWGPTKGETRVGVAEVVVKNAENLLVMLMIGTTTVRRQWFGDQKKSSNHRLVAVQTFDRNLQMIKNSLFTGTDTNKFENAVAALLFLMGFNPVVQIETDSPDLIVATPIGRMVIVECTFKTADFASKLGKLVDRRGLLVNSLKASNHPADVLALLVCRLPKSQIAMQEESLRSHNVILATSEDLTSAFEQLRFKRDPDEILVQAESALQHKPNKISP